MKLVTYASIFDAISWCARRNSGRGRATTSPNAFSTQLFGNGTVILSPVDRWTLELPLVENPWFTTVSPSDVAEFDGGELVDAILSLEFLGSQ